MDIICIDNWSDKKVCDIVPQMTKKDPLGVSWDLNLWVNFGGNNVHADINPNINTSLSEPYFTFRTQQDLRVCYAYGINKNDISRADKQKSLLFDDIAREKVKRNGDIGDVLIVGNSSPSETTDDLIFNEGKFTRVLILSPGRHFYKVLGDDFELIAESGAVSNDQRLNSCAEKTNHA